MQDHKGKIFVVSAPSGAGKTTILRSVLKEFPELVLSVSATTRPQREHEIDGKDYFFISEDDFIKKIKNDEFIEWENFYDYYYGTLKEFVCTKLKAGLSIVFEVDVKGALNIKKVHPESVMIFILPPSIDELHRRLNFRNTESKEDLKKRVDRATMEMSFKDEFDYPVKNENLEIAKNEVKRIIKSELEDL